MESKDLIGIAPAHLQHVKSAQPAWLTTYRWIISQLFVVVMTENKEGTDISFPRIILEDVCHKSPKGKKQKKRSGILPSAVQ